MQRELFCTSHQMQSWLKASTLRYVKGSCCSLMCWGSRRTNLFRINTCIYLFLSWRKCHEAWKVASSHPTSSHIFWASVCGSYLLYLLSITVTAFLLYIRKETSLQTNMWFSNGIIIPGPSNTHVAMNKSRLSWFIFQSRSGCYMAHTV